MSKITQKLIGLACTDGTLKSLVGSVKGYIKQAGLSPLKKNDRKFFMMHVLALMETAKEKRADALKIIEEHPHSCPHAFLKTLLDVVDGYITMTTESPLIKEQQDKLLDYIISGVNAAVAKSEKELEEILEKYYPESI